MFYGLVNIVTAQYINARTIDQGTYNGKIKVKNYARAVELFPWQSLNKYDIIFTKKQSLNDRVKSNEHSFKY